MSKRIVRTPKTKFSKRVEHDASANGRYQLFEDDEDIDLSAIRTSRDILEKEEESNAGC